jgi:hypothetical protein
MKRWTQVLAWLSFPADKMYLALLGIDGSNLNLEQLHTSKSSRHGNKISLLTYFSMDICNTRMQTVFSKLSSNFTRLYCNRELLNIISFLDKNQNLQAGIPCWTHTCWNI